LKKVRASSGFTVAMGPLQFMPPIPIMANTPVAASMAVQTTAVISVFFMVHTSNGGV
jgi:hypothetical protein